jgi:signal transduction histidine kinase
MNRGALFGNIEDSSFTNSSIFTRQLYNDLEMISDMANYYKNDEYVDSGAAFRPREQELVQQMKDQIKSDIRDAKIALLDEMSRHDEGTGRYYYPGYSQDESLIPENYSNEITVIKGAEYYNGVPLMSVVVDEDEITERVKKEYQGIINSERLDLTRRYRNTAEHISGIKNLSYIVINRNTGEIYTNFNGSVSKDANLLSMVDKDKWSLAVQNGKFSYGSPVYNNDGNQDYYDDYRKIDLDMYLSERFIGDNLDIFLMVNTDADTLVEGDGYYKAFNQYTKTYDHIKLFTSLFIASFVLCLAAFGFCCAMAGETDENGKVKLAKIDRVYTSIHFIISLSLFITGAVLVATFSKDIVQEFDGEISLWATSFTSAIGAAAAAVGTQWAMSVVRHVRNGTLLKHTLTNVLIVKNYERIKMVLSFEKAKHIRTKVVGIASVAVAVNLFLIMLLAVSVASGNGFFSTVFFGLIIIFDLAVIYMVKSSIKALDDLMEAIIQAQEGKFGVEISVSSMPLYLRDFAQRIVNLRDGMKIAVDEAVKGERMKTELITNVSHDLKTPLTSIISYVDLLKRCDLDDQTALSYIKVLEEKSGRLKKLIEDLVEASKASTGNVNMNITKVNLSELAVQLTGENEEELRAMGIDMRISVPQEAPIVLADSQKAFRAIENLMSNISKYAMPGTRVYVEVGRDNGYGFISIKNVSKDALDIPVEQLTQRFVRGDAARSSEGSGLGLSIAENLVTLQDGEFNIELDGDLFKATVKFKLDQELDL